MGQRPLVKPPKTRIVPTNHLLTNIVKNRKKEKSQKMEHYTMFYFLP